MDQSVLKFIQCYDWRKSSCLRWIALWQLKHPLVARAALLRHIVVVDSFFFSWILLIDRSQCDHDNPYLIHFQEILSIFSLHLLMTHKCLISVDWWSNILLKQSLVCFWGSCLCNTLFSKFIVMYLIWNIFFNNLLCLPHRFHPNLKLSEAQLLSLQTVHLPSALQDCIQAIVTAAGHKSVASALSRLSFYLLIDRLALPHVPTYSCRETLSCLSWQAALTRYTAKDLDTVWITCYNSNQHYKLLAKYNIFPNVQCHAVECLDCNEQSFVTSKCHAFMI